VRVALELLVINTSDSLATVVRAIELLRVGMRACLRRLRDTVEVWSAERRNHTERK